jgi:hypothetical protein
MAVTESEAYLESLARKSFLSMWSYPNPAFRNSGSTKAGEELCDLLVLFRNNVFLFEDKSSSYPSGDDPDLNWSRWHRRSIEGAVRQLIRAKKKLTQSTCEFFADLTCHTRFPLPLPNNHVSRYFLIAVTHGSGPQCRREYRRDSLTIDTRVAQNDGDRLAVGCQFDGYFVHILDDSTLDIVLNNRDTIVDFIHYLEQKETALSTTDFVIHGEENLLAHYLQNRNSDGDHFIPTSPQCDLNVIPDGLWDEFISSEAFRHSQQENRISYNIDMLIEHFTTSYLTGQLIEGQQEPRSHHEQALRLLASESRFGRRTISTSLVSILNEEATSHFWAATIPSFATAALRYVFLTYPDPPCGIGLEQCERYVLEHLSQYLLVARHVFPESSMIVGIAVPNPDCEMLSAFIRILDGQNWTANDHHEAAQLRKATGIFANLEEERYLHFE